jgi:hypothetical protein
MTFNHKEASEKLVELYGGKCPVYEQTESATISCF